MSTVFLQEKIICFVNWVCEVLMCMSVGHSNVGQNRYVSCNGMSVLGRCSIKFWGGLYVYV